MSDQMLLNEVAKEIGVKAYQISYAISSGSIPETCNRENQQ